VMEQQSGDVPPDVMPYNFGSWVTEASPAQRTLLQRESVHIWHSYMPWIRPSSPS